MSLLRSLLQSSIVIPFFRRNNCQEIRGDALRVSFEQLTNAILFARIKYQADVFRLRHAVHDLFVRVMRSIGLVLIRERECNTREILSEFRQLVWIFFSRCLKLCPLAPEIEIARVLENIRDISSADATCDLEQVKLSILGAMQ